MASCACRTDTLLVAVDETDIADMADVDLLGDDAFLPTATHTNTTGQGCLDLSNAKVSFRRDFELTRDVLGVGMSGSVVTAVNKRSGEKVAVKTYSLGKLTASQRIDLQFEVRHQSSLDHPGLARLQAVYKSSKRVRLVMEHLDGGDLCDHLEERGPFSEAATKNKSTSNTINNQIKTLKP